MPEAAVAEAPVESEAPPIAEPAKEAPPTPAEGDTPPPEGDATPDAEGGQGDYAEVEAELEAEVVRRVEARASKAEETAALKGAQRTKEADDGESARLQLYVTAENEARTRAASLRELARNGEVDDDVLTEHMTPIIAGVQAYIARENETSLKAYVDAMLPEQTQAEQDALEPLLYEFRRNGRFDKLPQTVAELALGRKDAEIADLKKQLGDRKGVIAAAKKLADLREAAGNGVGSKNIRGSAANDRSAITREMQAIDVTTPEGREEFERRQPEFRRRLAAL